MGRDLTQSYDKSPTRTDNSTKQSDKTKIFDYEQLRTDLGDQPANANF